MIGSENTGCCNGVKLMADILHAYERRPASLIRLAVAGLAVPTVVYRCAGDLAGPMIAVKSKAMSASGIFEYSMMHDG